MSIHAYRRQKNGKVVRSKTVNTMGKLKKSPDHCHSITAVTSDIRNDFLDNVWKDSKIIEIARANPDWDVAKCQEARWGYRDHPETGEQMTSSDFGTAAHDCMENMLIQYKEGADYHSPYAPLCRPFLEHIEADGVLPKHMELMVLDERRRVGGTIDFVGETFGAYEIYDFKFRTSTNAYDKDMVQLAIASDIVRDQFGLDHYPRIFSIVIDCNTGKMKRHEWGEVNLHRGIDWFDCMNKCFMYRYGLL